MRYLTLALLLAGCAYSTRPEHYPSRGSHICVVNSTNDTLLSVVSRRSDGAALVSWQRLNPGKVARFRWPWIDNQGMLLAGPYNTYISPWSASYWRWDIRAKMLVSSQTPLC